MVGAAVLQLAPDRSASADPVSMGRATWSRLRGTSRPKELPASDEYVLPAIITKRLAGEPAVECLQRETGDVEKPKPFILRCPPGGTCRAVVEDHIDPIVANRVANPMRYGTVLMLAVEARGDPVIESKGVPGKSPTGPKEGGDPLECASPVCPRRQVQQRAIRTVNQRRRFFETQIAHVSVP